MAIGGGCSHLDIPRYALKAGGMPAIIDKLCILIGVIVKHPVMIRKGLVDDSVS